MLVGVRMRMIVPVQMLPRRILGGGDHQLRLVDPLQPRQFRREFLQFLRRAAKRDQFHAEVVVQVHVHTADDAGRVGVLDFDHRIGELRPVVVVDECQTRGHIRGGGAPGVLG